MALQEYSDLTAERFGGIHRLGMRQCDSMVIKSYYVGGDHISQVTGVTSLSRFLLLGKISGIWGKITLFHV